MRFRVQPMKTPQELGGLPDNELSKILAAMNGWEFCIRARTKHGKPLPWAMEHCRHPYYTCGRWRPMCRMVKYAHDLNACHDVALGLDRDQRNSYINRLDEMVLDSMDDEDRVRRDFEWCCATPRQRTIALILTLQKP